MGKKFNRWLRAQAKAGVFVGDINQATAAFQGTAPLPTPPTQTPTPPPEPEPIARNTTPCRVGTQGLEDGGNLRIKKKSRRRRQQLSKGTGQLRINPTTTANVGGAGAAASSGGINV